MNKSLRKPRSLTVKAVLDMGCTRRELWSVVAALEMKADRVSGGERRTLRHRSATVKRALLILDQAQLAG